MKKLITLLILFVGMVSTASASKTIYLKPNSNWKEASARFALYAFGDGEEWYDMNAVAGVDGYYSATIDDKYPSIILCRMNPATAVNNWDNKWTQTGNISSPAHNDVYEIVDWEDYNKTSISSVTFSYGKYGQTPWDNLALTADGGLAYSATVDLTSDTDYRDFKIIVNNNWLGTNEISLTDAESLVTVGGSTGDNFKLNNKKYKKYTLTATWTPSTSATAGWTLTVTGSEARETTEYTVTFVDGNNWGDGNVYAYTYGSEQSGAWPGTKMTRDGSVTISGTEYPKYTYTFTAYSPYPTHIIFNNNNSGQTGNLTLTNGHQYIDGVAMDPVYYVVGSSTELFNGSWNTATTTDLMEGPVSSVYTFTKSNVALSNGNITLKVIKKAYPETETVDAWYPAEDVILNIPVDGKYNVTITFNSSTEEVTAAAVITAVHATIGGAGCATFSSTHDLDFTDVTGLTAYTATSAGGGFVHMDAVSGKVPAGTGLFLSGASDYIPVTTGAGAVGTNLLLPTSGSDIYNSSLHQYVLANQSGLGFYKVASSLSPDAGKAYLETSTAIGSDPSARVAIIFEDETTGIETAKASQKMNGEFFNLAGQRVAQPTKGLYIVNGKKVIMK